MIIVIKSLNNHGSVSVAIFLRDSKYIFGVCRFNGPFPIKLDSLLEGLNIRNNCWIIL